MNTNKRKGGEYFKMKFKLSDEAMKRIIDEEKKEVGLSKRHGSADGDGKSSITNSTKGYFDSVSRYGTEH